MSKKGTSRGDAVKAERDERLISAVDQLRDEVRVLWQAIDELREVYDHAFQNRDPIHWPPLPHRWISSVPLDPETLAEFPTFVARRGEEELSAEQLQRFDELPADQSREQRAGRRSKTSIAAKQLRSMSSELNGSKPYRLRC